MSLPALSSSTVPGSAESVVARWSVEDRDIKLLCAQDQLKFSVCANGVESKRGAVPLKLYDLTYALNLVKLFHEVIRENLVDAVYPSSFLPCLCTDALLLRNGQMTPSKRILVVLFGRVNILTNDVMDARFGIFDEDRNAVHSSPVRAEDETTKQFLLNAPQYDRPCTDETSSHHYAMTRYAKRFRPVITCSQTGHIQSVGMKHISLIDRNKVLDCDHWSVTLLSANGGGSLSGVGSSLGHSMLACEGIEKTDRGEERPFLKYAHITTMHLDPQRPDPQRASDEARVEIFNREEPLTRNCTYGPTWVYSQSQVSSMLQNMQRAIDTQQYVRFSRVGDVSNRFIEEMDSRPVTEAERQRSPIRAAMRSFLQNVSRSAFKLGAQAETMGGRRPLGTNCKDWCLAQMREAGMPVQLTPNIFAPSTLVERLNAGIERENFV